MGDNIYRVLSLDGGGAWALLEVMALIDLYGEETTGHEVLRNFDLAAANSGGSLVLGGLVEDMNLNKILNFFKDETKRRTVFSPTRRFWDKWIHTLLGIGPKYDTQAKLPAIEMLFPAHGIQPLPVAANSIGSPTHLLIVGFDYDRNRSVFFRSAPASKPGWGSGAPSNATLAEAIHASTNAPVNYFDAPAQFHTGDSRYWDGGITGCNNPVMAAVVEALILGNKPENIRVLSLGTGSVTLPQAKPWSKPAVYEEERQKSWLVADLRKLATAVLDDPPDAASFLAHVVTGAGRGVRGKSDSNIIRLSPLVAPQWNGQAWTLPSDMTEDQFKYLKELDMDAVEQEQADAIEQFGKLWLDDAVTNQPVRIRSSDFQAEIGYVRYSDAKKAWWAIS